MARPGQKHPTLEKVRGSNVRSISERKLGKDGPNWTPTEKIKRSRLLKQFSARNKGYAVAISEDYRAGYDAIDWSDGPKPGDLDNCGKKR